MNPIVIKNTVIGEGSPKICIPIVGVTREQILNQAAALGKLPVHLVEWRADWFDQFQQTEQVLSLLSALRQKLPDLPLLFTFRTAKEGGREELSPEAYEALLEAVIRSGLADLIDIEFFAGQELVQRLTALAREQGVATVVSNHDFEKTPEEAELVRRLSAMRQLGADLPKIAVMPQSVRDVITLLSATEQASRILDCPVITMSMGSLGAVSRLCGEVFGSAVTFGSAGQASAPGQIEAEELCSLLEEIHKIYSA